VALIGADIPQEGGTIPGVFLPIHAFALVSPGVNLLDNLALDDLAATADRLNRSEVMLMVETLGVEKRRGCGYQPGGDLLTLVPSSKETVTVLSCSTHAAFLISTSTPRLLRRRLVICALSCCVKC